MKLSSILLGAGLAAIASADANLLLVGDWGADYDLTDLQTVANAMNVVANTTSVTAIISVGDNFYQGGRWNYDGVASLSDTKFDELWSKVYSGSNIKNLPWWLVLGNHDWYTAGSFVYELAYKGHPNWNLDDYFYTRRVAVDTGVYASFIFIDSDLAQYGYEGDGYQYPKMKNNFKTAGWSPEKYTLEKQLAWIDNQLSIANKDAYVFIIAHHGAYACGWDLNHSYQIQAVADLAYKWDVNMYAHGHHHTMAHYWLNGNKTLQVQIGSTGNIQDVCAPADDKQPGQEVPNTFGFGHLNLKKSLATLNFIDESGTTRMSVPFSPRNPVLGVSANTTFLTAQNDPSVHAYFPSSVVPCVRNVFTVVLENQDYADVMADPYMGTTLANKGYLMTNYYANTHPSQGNYIAMIAGSLFGVTDDSNVDLNGKNVADLLEAKGLTWKSYQEAYPGECFTGQISGTYWRKHNPFISFTSISKNASRCANIVSSVQLDKDAVAGNLPNYIFYSPDINNDGHDTGLTVASNWLKAFLEPKLTDPAYANTLFQVVFDESQNNIPSQNRIYALLAGAGITQQGARDNSSYTHYNLLATLENVFSLGNLGQNDVAAATIPLSCDTKPPATPTTITTATPSPTGTPSKIKWNYNGDGSYWALACDWVAPLYGNKTVKGEQCGSACESAKGCTRFSWSPSSVSVGDCWFFGGPFDQNDVVLSNATGVVCGGLPPKMWPTFTTLTSTTTTTVVSVVTLTSSTSVISSSTATAPVKSTPVSTPTTSSVPKASVGISLVGFKRGTTNITGNVQDGCVSRGVLTSDERISIQFDTPSGIDCGNSSEINPRLGRYFNLKYSIINLGFVNSSTFSIEVRPWMPAKRGDLTEDPNSWRLFFAVSSLVTSTSTTTSVPSTTTTTVSSTSPSSATVGGSSLPTSTSSSTSTSGSVSPTVSASVSSTSGSVSPTVSASVSSTSGSVSPTVSASVSSIVGSTSPTFSASVSSTVGPASLTLSSPVTSATGSAAVSISSSISVSLTVTVSASTTVTISSLPSVSGKASSPAVSATFSAPASSSSCTTTASSASSYAPAPVPTQSSDVSSPKPSNLYKAGAGKDFVSGTIVAVLASFIL